MTRIKRLKHEARGAALWRGHRMTPFVQLSSTVARSLCVLCSASVDVNTQPAPNQIDIGGDAVALNCPVDHDY